MIFREL